MKLYLAFLVIFLSAFTFGESGNDFTDLEMHILRMEEDPKPPGCSVVNTPCRDRSECCSFTCDVKDGVDGKVCLCGSLNFPCQTDKDCCDHLCGHTTNGTACIISKDDFK